MDAKILSQFGLSRNGHKPKKSPNLCPKIAQNCTNMSRVCFEKPGLAGHSITQSKCSNNEPLPGSHATCGQSFSIIPEL